MPIISVVREFYANAYEHKGRNAFVRWKWVAFDLKMINTNYSLLSFPARKEDECTKYAHDHVNLDEIITYLCSLGHKWKQEMGQPTSFKANRLNRTSKI